MYHHTKLDFWGERETARFSKIPDMSPRAFQDFFFIFSSKIITFSNGWKGLVKMDDFS